LVPVRTTAKTTADLALSLRLDYLSSYLKVLAEDAPPPFDISGKFVDITARLTSDWADDLKCCLLYEDF
jgi:hypothetical protein